MREHAATLKHLSKQKDVCGVIHAEITVDLLKHATLVPTDLHVILGDVLSKSPQKESQSPRANRKISTRVLKVWLPKAILEMASQRYLDELSQGGPLLKLLGLPVPSTAVAPSTVASSSAGAGPSRESAMSSSAANTLRGGRHEVIDLTGMDDEPAHEVIDLTGDDVGDEMGAIVQNTAAAMGMRASQGSMALYDQGGDRDIDLT